MTVVRVESVAGGSTPSDRPTPRGQPLIRGGYNFDSTAVRLIFTVSEINGNFSQTAEIFPSRVFNSRSGGFFGIAYHRMASKIMGIPCHAEIGL